MISSILITLVSLIGLLALHEFGHFALAKKFGVGVEEFGIGYPPRIFGKKIGQTVYSLNLLPFGAFVRIYGEEGQEIGERSFRSKPIWQRALIILGGVVTFWIAAVLLFTLVAGNWGLPVAVEDEANASLIDLKVQIIEVMPDSPAEKAGIKIGDIIKKMESQGVELETDKVKEIAQFTDFHRGERVVVTLQRGKDILETSLVPRISPPEKEGPMGIGLVRTALKLYSWTKAPIEAILLTGRTTLAIPRILGSVLLKSLRGQEIPGEIEARGPIGVGQLMTQAANQGINYFLYFVAIISVHVAVFNILPIPPADGGRLLFLLVEKIKGEPIDSKLERNINAFFFSLLLIIMVFVTIKDITRFF